MVFASGDAEHKASASAPFMPGFAKATLPSETKGSREFSRLHFGLFLSGLAVSTVSSFAFSLSFFNIAVAALILALPTFATYMIIVSNFFSAPLSSVGKLPGYPSSHYLEYKDKALEAKYGEGKIPMEVFFEAYMHGKLDIKGDVLDTLESRYDFVSFGYTWNQVKFFVLQWIPETLWHSRDQDKDQVQDHYDRGDDFYEAFLGSVMIYTSGIVQKPFERESLEELQVNKMKLVCEKIQLKEGEKHLDIGCGWGTLAVYAGKEYKSNSTGVTLSKNQAAYARGKAKAAGVEKNADFWCIDYRDIPHDVKYNKITCLEMSEHVGVRKYDEFTTKVYDLLEDDGLFFLQIAGLRRRWQYEDFSWGLFMAKYVFPGADASCPLAWVVNKLEYAGFEVFSVDNIGVHYSATIERWYRNWLGNKEVILKAYDQYWYRRWAMFLAWSVIAARQGTATCYQLVCHKNVNRYDRTLLIDGKRLQA